MARKFLSPVDIASVFGVHRSTLDKWVKKGLLPPPIKIGAVVRHDRDVVLEFLAKRMTYEPVPERQRKYQRNGEQSAPAAPAPAPAPTRRPRRSAAK